MSQQVVFDTAPTTNPDEAIGHARTIVNTQTGIGMDALLKIVEEHVPHARNERTRTRKVIIRTDRYECPCCRTSLSALVSVSCEGVCTSEADQVRGLYGVRIYPDGDHYRVVVERLSGAVIYEGVSDELPQKDYDANPEARLEIATTTAAFAQLALENPGRVVRVDGIETPDDAMRLAEAIGKLGEDE